MSRLKSTGQVEAAASDWWHAVSRAEFEQSHDFQSQRAASRVAATLATPKLTTPGGQWQKYMDTLENQIRATKGSPDGTPTGNPPKKIPMPWMSTEPSWTPAKKRNS